MSRCIQVFHSFETGLELLVKSLADHELLILWLLPFWSTGVADVCHHARFYTVLGTEPRAVPADKHSAMTQTVLPSSAIFFFF